MTDWLSDLGWAVRSLRARRMSALLIILTFAGGIGANVAVFSIVYALLLQPLPFPRADRLVVLSTEVAGAPGKLSPREYRALSQDLRLFERAAPFYPTQYNVTSTGAAPESLPSTTTTADLFEVLGVRTIQGSVWAPTLDFTRQYTVVLGEGLWRRRYGADPSIVGRSIRLDHRDYVVTGVVAQGADFPNRTDVFRAITEYNQEDLRRLHVVARLPEGVTPATAQATLDAFSARLAERFPESNHGVRLVATPLRRATTGDLGAYAWMLGAAVGFVLLLTCANVANLQLSRVLHRQGEIATRQALGATPARIVRLLLLESCLLALIGGVVGLAVAWAVLSGLMTIIQPQLPPWVDVRLDPTALAVSMILALIAGLAAGVVPALRWSTQTLEAALRGTMRGSAGAAQGRLRRALTAAETAFAVLLLVAAGLATRSIWKLSAIDLGFASAGLLTFRVDPPWGRYPDAATTSEFYRRAIEALEQLPGVSSAAVNQNLPIARQPDAVTRTLYVDGQPPMRRGDQPFVNVQPISPRYFEAMQIPLVRGRMFSHLDLADTERVAIVNRRLAERYWPGANPLGQRLRLEGPEARRAALSQAGAQAPSVPMPWVTIVGVVTDVRHEAVTAPAGFDVYVPVTQEFAGDAYVVVRTTVDPNTVAALVGSTIRTIDADQSIFDVRTMRAQLDQALWSQRLTGWLFPAFATLAWLLAAIGLYGVLSQAVGERVREIGVRMALGAGPPAILRLVGGEALVTVGVGAAIGLLAAWPLARLSARFFFGVSATDPLVYAATLGALGLAALSGVLVPSLRALRVDPVSALRQ
jgi:putative ABC transport system permease protein